MFTMITYIKTYHNFQAYCGQKVVFWFGVSEGACMGACQSLHEQIDWHTRLKKITFTTTLTSDKYWLYIMFLMGHRLTIKVECLQVIPRSKNLHVGWYVWRLLKTITSLQETFNIQIVYSRIGLHTTSNQLPHDHSKTPLKFNAIKNLIPIKLQNVNFLFYFCWLCKVSWLLGLDNIGWILTIIGWIWKSANPSSSCGQRWFNPCSCFLFPK